MADPKLPQGVTLDQLRSNWDTATSAHATAFRRIRLLDAADRGRVWDALRAKFPSYQLLPDTNHVSYVKNNLVASLYSVGKSASLIPTSAEDKEMVAHVNMALQHYWDLGDFGYHQMRTGDRAALTNLGVMQIGWDLDLVGGSGDTFYKGAPTCKVVDPTKFMRDPYSIDLENAAYCMTWEIFHKNVLKGFPQYKDQVEKALAKIEASTTAQPVELHRDRPTDAEAAGKKDYVRLIMHWVRIGNDYHEIHTLDNEHVLLVKEKIQPATFPFALLYCNDPAGDLVGTSEPAKVFSNSVAYNIINSLVLTAEYKNQRPPKFVSDSAGLNLASFIKHGNEADMTFVVQGDASKAVHYHQFPQPSQNASVIMAQLGRDVQQISGVDSRYTGRDTGSILTTGGVESMLNQVTQIDTPKIVNYERFARRATQLVLDNLIQFGGKRKLFIRDPKSIQDKVVEIDFPKLNADALHHYAISISSELPRNKQRLAQVANTLMEKQMQYAATGGKVEFITPEEWLMLQDLPIKELIQERMGIQRNQDYVKQVSQTLFQFAELTKNGVSPEDAIQLTADQLQMENTPGQNMGPQPQPEQMVDLSGQPPVQF